MSTDVKLPARLNLIQSSYSSLAGSGRRLGEDRLRDPVADRSSGDRFLLRRGDGQGPRPGLRRGQIV